MDTERKVPITPTQRGNVGEPKQAEDLKPAGIQPGKKLTP